MKIGVITDTHGQIHPKVFEHFQGVEKILHTGDIDTEEILVELEAIAPVIAVRGNVDPYQMGNRLSKSKIEQIEGFTILMIHQALDGNDIHPDVKDEMHKQKIDLVLFGHTHIPYQKTHQGTLFLNPGGGGRKRFNLPRGVGILDLNKGQEINAKIIPLE